VCSVKSQLDEITLPLTNVTPELKESVSCVFGDGSDSSVNSDPYLWRNSNKTSWRRAKPLAEHHLYLCQCPGDLPAGVCSMEPCPCEMIAK